MGYDVIYSKYYKCIMKLLWQQIDLRNISSDNISDAIILIHFDSYNFQELSSFWIYNFCTELQITVKTYLILSSNPILRIRIENPKEPFY